MSLLYAILPCVWPVSSSMRNADFNMDVNPFHITRYRSLAKPFQHPRNFYKPQPLGTLEEIRADILVEEEAAEDMLGLLLKGDKS